MFSILAGARWRTLATLFLLSANGWLIGASGARLLDLRRTVSTQIARLELVILLDKNVTPARRRELFEAARIPQVKKLDLVLAPALLKSYSGALKVPSDDLRASNPLGDELHVALHDPHDFWKVRTYLTSLRGVRGARAAHVGAALPARWRSVRDLTLVAGVALAALSTLQTVLIAWFLRRAWRFRAAETRVMQLVGATPAFIRAPFWMSGLALGIGAATLASTALRPTLAPTLLLVATPAWCALALGTLGAASSIVGAWWTLRRAAREGAIGVAVAIHAKSTV